MTREEAISILMSTASSWAENMEESLADRVDASDTDEILMVKAHDDPIDYETALQIRDIWRAINLLRK